MKIEDEWKGEDLISNLATISLFGGMISSFITMILEGSGIIELPLTPFVMIGTFVILGLVVAGGFILGLKKANENAGTIILKGMITQGRQLGEMMILEVVDVIKTVQLPRQALEETQQYIEYNRRAWNKVKSGTYSHLKITNKILLLEEAREEYEAHQ